MTVALEVTGLSKTFALGRRLIGPPRAHVRAVQPLSLTIKKGETLGIVGESGCGKSTLARMLAGLLKPSSGQIEIEGETLNAADSPTFGRRIQYVFQDPVSSLNPRKTIRQIMEAPLKHLHRMSKEAREKRIAEIFTAVNLRLDFLDRYPHEFSGGQAQRIVIGRALAANARILILDEPVSALDVSIQAQVLNLLSDLKKKFDLTYLFISHDLAVVEAISDRVAVLYFGSIVEIGPANQIFTKPRHPYTKLLAESAPVVGRPLTAPEGREIELPDPQNPPQGCSFRARCSRALGECGFESPDLVRVAENQMTACFNSL
ncbi:MAG: ATP-binding cassette domain-containing protein [Albidovulum sp.]|nr:ATP-binding cassette domain-containing protein [Albidovulum sp.]